MLRGGREPGTSFAALRSTGAPIRELTLIGGGAPSRFWSRLVASAIGLPSTRSAVGPVGPALGAARLARVGLGGALIASAADGEEIAPSPSIAEALARKRDAYEAHLGLPRG